MKSCVISFSLREAKAANVRSVAELVGLTACITIAGVDENAAAILISPRLLSINFVSNNNGGVHGRFRPSAFR